MKHTVCLSGKKWSRTDCLLVWSSCSDWWWEELQNVVFSQCYLRGQKKDTKGNSSLPANQMWSISTYNQGTFENPEKFTYLPPLCRASWNHLHESFWTLKKRGERWLLCKEELVSNHLTGFKKYNWDQIFSVWQSGQYRAPVIKPLPVKHPVRIDEFSPGEGGAVTGASGAWRRDFEHGTVPGMLKFICEGRAILATSDFKTDHEKRSWLALTGQTRRLLAVSKCTSNTK